MPADLGLPDEVRLVRTSPEFTADSVPDGQAGYHVLGSWYILGELIRRIVGRAPDCFVREVILEPCGLNAA